MSRRSAPRSAVVRQWKTGAYATTVWYTELACGHVDQRRRRPVASNAACLRCEAQESVEAVSDRAPVNAPWIGDAEVAVLGVQIATALGVSADSVKVEVDAGRVAGARVLLDPVQIGNLVSQLAKPPAP